MNRLLEKLAILLICIPAFFMFGDDSLTVASLLIAVSASAVVQLLTGKKVAAVIIAVVCVLSGWLPAIFCALPLLFYDALCEKTWWAAVPAVSVLMHPESLQSGQIICVIAGMATAAIIYRRVSGLELSVGKLTLLRDEITEKNMQLAEQNNRISEAQNNEIRLATLRERNRIAREIHDNVGHMLTRSILQTGALQIINHDEALKEPLAELKQTLDGAMTSIRSSVHDLHDTSIDLRKAITEMADAVDERFEVSVNYDAGAHIPGEIKLCVAGIVKEGISNAVKHSNGSKIEIVFREHPAFYQLLIKDNGTAAEIGRGGIGLRNMKDRVASVGGRISFTASESGFQIFMTISKEQ
ncbi:MAG: sensor histidine kinase [Oscillospiraceae bacterium]|nr:sensor histidine kinase [Oscillospiraceae bacterium]